MEIRPLLHRTADLAADFLEQLDDRPVHAAAGLEELRAALGGELPDGPLDPAAVVEELAAASMPGIVASAGPRYFGFVIGGTLPAALAADWLATAWDNNAAGSVVCPAGNVVEEVAGAWIKGLVGLPSCTSVGFTTGGMMASFTCLLAARRHVLGKVGWDVDEDGLCGAPPVRIVVGSERHPTIDVSMRYLGLGPRRSVVVDADEQGRMRPDALRRALAEGGGPTIVCAQAGGLNTGAFDPLEEVCDAAAAASAWVHVDGAVGLWAAASVAHRHLTAGMERADSWATDSHKWLNVPYDSGLALCRHPEDHRAAVSATAPYLLLGGPEAPRDGFEWVPEFSRRARGFAVYAALRSLGRRGVEALVDRCCSHARRFAEALGGAPGVEVLNDVVLNQVLVRFGGSDAHTRAVVERLQREGTAWFGTTVWRGRAAMRISVVNWRTSISDVDRSVEAILAAHRAIS